MAGETFPLIAGINVMIMEYVIVNFTENQADCLLGPKVMQPMRLVYMTFHACQKMGIFCKNFSYTLPQKKRNFYFQFFMLTPDQGH